MEAVPAVRIAQIGGALVVVVALEQGITGQTLPVGACVPRGTGIAIVTRQVVRLEYATHVWIAEVIGAEVAVVLADLRFAGANRPHTGVVGGALVAVITGSFQRLPLAPSCRQAGIGGTRVAILTVQGVSHAHSVEAIVGRRARITVVAIVVRRLVDTPHLGVAQVIGARIPVIAGQQFSDAPTVQTLVVRGTIEAVVARGVVELGVTPFVRIAEVVRARILIGAIFGSSGLALAINAAIPFGAHILVIAFRFARYRAALGTADGRHAPDAPFGPRIAQPGPAQALEAIMPQLALAAASAAAVRTAFDALTIGLAGSFGRNVRYFSQVGKIPGFGLVSSHLRSKGPGVGEGVGRNSIPGNNLVEGTLRHARGQEQGRHTEKCHPVSSPKRAQHSKATRLSQHILSAHAANISTEAVKRKHPEDAT